MLPDAALFDRSILQHFAINRARTPHERFLALCDLLDAARTMAPKGPEARQRRLLALAIRQQEREQFRAQCRRLFAASRSNPQLDH